MPAARLPADVPTVAIGGRELALRGRACHLPAAGALVVADLHVGRAAASDVEYPLGERADLRDRLAAAVERFDPGTVAFAGDLLHRFGDASARSVDALRDLIGAVRAAGVRAVVVAGNHDVGLDGAWPGDVHDEFRLSDGTVVCHGHEEPSADAPAYVVGHDHPTIAIEGQRRPCLLYGEGVYRDADLLVLPAFSRVAPGVEVNRMDAGDFASPLVRDADALRPVVHDPDADETLAFPPLGRFRRML
ncbi:MAG: metallophosphoesterase [Haloferacaceae archaeon]